MAIEGTCRRGFSVDASLL